MARERPPLRTFYLEMFDPSDLCESSPPEGFEVFRVDPPSHAVNARFYRDVGADWAWTDRLSWTEEDWRRYLQRDALQTWVGLLAGREIGYFELESDGEGSTQLVYFGLLPEFLGRGLGGALLTSAITCAWAVPGTRRVWVHTCTWDHRHALDNYRKRGFTVYRTEPA